MPLKDFYSVAVPCFIHQFRLSNEDETLELESIWLGDCLGTLGEEGIDLDTNSISLLSSIDSILLKGEWVDST